MSAVAAAEGVHLTRKVVYFETISVNEFLSDSALTVSVERVPEL